MNRVIWQLTVEKCDRGWLDFESHVPGVACNECGDQWASWQYHPTSGFGSSRLRHDADNLPFLEVAAYCQLLHDRGVRSLLRPEQDLSAPYWGFFPGNSMGEILWKKIPKRREPVEPVFDSIFVVREDIARFANQLDGVWFVPIANFEDAFAVVSDNERVVLPPAIDGLEYKQCKTCKYQEWSKSPKQLARNGMIASTLKRKRAIPACMVPSRDVFIVGYLHSWFLSEKIVAILGDSLSKSSYVRLVRWSVTDSLDEIFESTLLGAFS